MQMLNQSTVDSETAAYVANSPRLYKWNHFSITTCRHALLFGISLHAGEMGEASRVTPTGAVAYQRHPFVIRFLSETEVAHGTGRYIHRQEDQSCSPREVICVDPMFELS
jgi:hypothetical protein